MKASVLKVQNLTYVFITTGVNCFNDFFFLFGEINLFSTPKWAMKTLWYTVICYLQMHKKFNKNNNSIELISKNG